MGLDGLFNGMPYKDIENIYNHIRKFETYTKNNNFTSFDFYIYKMNIVIGNMKVSIVNDEINFNKKIEEFKKIISFMNDEMNNNFKNNNEILDYLSKFSELINELKKDFNHRKEWKEKGRLI